MVKGTLLGPEPSTFSSQRAHCLSASRLAPLSSCYASICHSSLGPVPTLSTSCLFLFFSFFRLHSIHLSPWSTFPPPVFICPPLWYFHIGVVFPSLPPFTLSWIHHWFPLTLNRSLIHYFHLFTPCPALAVFFEIR